MRARFFVIVWGSASVLKAAPGLVVVAGDTRLMGGEQDRCLSGAFLAFGVAWHCCSPGDAASLVSLRSKPGKGVSIADDKAGAEKNGKRRNFEAQLLSNLCRQQQRIVNNNAVVYFVTLSTFLSPTCRRVLSLWRGDTVLEY